MGTMKQKILLITILLLGSFLRFYKISSIPPGINWDEAAVGFNAHLITQSGRDEWGQKYPLFFRSFDDYKAPLQTYLVALSVKLFGVNEFAVRLPSALAGTLSILLIYILTKSFRASKASREIQRTTSWPEKYALLSALLLAITPWSIHFSRAAFEANIALLFILIALIFFNRWLNDHKLKWLSLTALFFLLTPTHRSVLFINSIHLSFLQTHYSLNNYRSWHYSLSSNHSFL
jgi:4-amino-4-deoxy-L-arabinose transferase-like glycosyltransferase